MSDRRVVSVVCRYDEYIVFFQQPDDFSDIAVDDTENFGVAFGILRVSCEVSFLHVDADKTVIA